MVSNVCVQCAADFPHPPTVLCNKEQDIDIAEDIKQAVAKLGRPEKSDEDMLDPLSTGRKRAAQVLPDELLDTMICEWALLKQAGGGISPIEGCHGNKATDRHHGPDKNTLNNERGVNLHGICSFCHNRWHAQNDVGYQEPRPIGKEWLPNREWSPHNPRDKMTVKEALIKEIQRYKE